jgi:hypothetical protein
MALRLEGHRQCESGEEGKVGLPDPSLDFGLVRDIADKNVLRVIDFLQVDVVFIVLLSQ